ncbi:putative P-loop ATPase fused to an acetyltransferase [Trachipleistophora hominis]|uniref:Putative P-loop ATPase fused to an acetyltransferase n=1 Tax=Trachipleistophora hominis TaxID=72359 RepID=L7JSE0_TRAHO|nr:putative P-loop ATPase fused to an acetyltransferase [Trachipleistophora hominis]
MDEIETDKRVADAIKQAVNQGHRSFFILNGDNSKNNVPILYNLLSERCSFLPSVLWCYCKKSKSREEKKKKMKKEKKSAKCCINDDDIKKVSYQEVDIVMGNTYEMLVLENFEKISPNTLAKTVETVKGGGVIVVLMDNDKNGLFNTRLYKSLCESDHVMFLDQNMKLISKFSLSSWRTGDENTDRLTLKNELCVTVDQDNAVAQLGHILMDRNNKNIALLKASRGRGKSAALGLAVADAVELRYSIVYIVAPHIENVKMLFEFVLRGLRGKGYKENADFDITRIFKGRSYVQKIVVKKNHRQIIEYHGFLDKMDRYPDLLVVDEAAAIPLPILKDLIRANIVLMASTMDGYEGTGRSLSMRFIEKLKKNDKDNPYVFKEIELNESIRYKRNDPVERWLNDVLILKPADYKNKLCPSPDTCQFFFVNKKTLFSYHKVSELFLKQMMSIFVSSHYKNTPDDLKIIADEPDHHVFVLLAPEKEKKLPRIICAAHVALEGKVTGERKDGNLIPWTLSEQFLDKNFLERRGCRIVRIAVHPDYQNMKYGTRMIELLVDTFSRGEARTFEFKVTEALLLPSTELSMPRIDWMGVSMGLNTRIFKFWGRNAFYPVYIKQTLNFNTGDYTSILLRNVNQCFDRFYFIFRERFLNLINFMWCEFPVELCMMLTKIKQRNEMDTEKENLSNKSIDTKYKANFGEFELARLESYVNGYSELNVVYDLIPIIARDYFHNARNFLSVAQESILLAVGGQMKTMNVISRELDITKEQVQILVKKVVAKFLRETKV